MLVRQRLLSEYPDYKARVAHMGRTWFLSAPGGPHVGPINLATGTDLHESECFYCLVKRRTGPLVHDSPQRGHTMQE